MGITTGFLKESGIQARHIELQECSSMASIFANDDDVECEPYNVEDLPELNVKVHALLNAPYMKIVEVVPIPIRGL